MLQAAAERYVLLDLLISESTSIINYINSKMGFKREKCQKKKNCPQIEWMGSSNCCDVVKCDEWECAINNKYSFSCKNP